MTDRDLFYGTSGPTDAPIVIVGESWGEEEAARHRPFVGPSGMELRRLLSEAGISEHQILFTNLIAEKPYGNETWRFFSPKSSNPNTERIGGLIPSSLALSEIKRLYGQLSHRPRSLVIATGNYALWGLSRVTGATLLRESNGRAIPPDLQTYAPTGIVDYRGSMLYVDPDLDLIYNIQYIQHWLSVAKGDVEALSRTPLLPIIHPASILREWSQRAPTLHDLRDRVPKALRADWRPEREPTALAPPTFDDTIAILSNWAQVASPTLLACDIETFRHQFISCIGFSDNADFAISIPFIRGVHPDGTIESYWTPDQEATILALLHRLFRNPHIHLVGQNFIYDIQYIQHWLGISPPLHHDTMLAQNVLFPGTPKDLGYLSSLYCHYHWYWKDDVKDWSRFGNLPQLLNYNAIDVMRTWEIAHNQLKLIDALNQHDQMAFKMRVNQLCLRMMNRGVLIDTARRGSMLFELQAAQSSFYSELLQIIPQDLVKPIEKRTDKPWYRSAKQTATLFYDILGMKAVTHRKTGNPTVGKEALMSLERKYPEFTGLFRRLDYAGSVSNTITVLQTPAEYDGRMRCSYNPGGTETHRLSSSENVFGRGTNLQNLTKGEEDD